MTKCVDGPQPRQRALRLPGCRIPEGDIHDRQMGALRSFTERHDLPAEAMSRIRGAPSRERYQMEEYSVSQWFERRGRQVRRNRVFANCLVPAVGLMLLLGYLAPPLEKRSHIVNILVTSMGVPLGILIAVSIFANASLIAGPYCCPSCNESFAARSLPGWVPRRCRNCAFDVHTMKRKRLKGPLEF